jgi:hypothetical protein
LQENRDPAVHLDRGFWLATGVIVIVSLIAIAWWVLAPITALMPEAVDRAQTVFGDGAIGHRHGAARVDRGNQLSDCGLVGPCAIRRVKCHDLGTGIEHLTDLAQRRRDIRFEAFVLALDDADDGNVYAAADGLQVAHALNAHAGRAVFLRRPCHCGQHLGIVERRACARLNRDDQSASQFFESAHPLRVGGVTPPALYASSSAPAAAS